MSFRSTGWSKAHMHRWKRIRVQDPITKKQVTKYQCMVCNTVEESNDV